MKKPLDILFGEWLPDLPPLNNPGCLNAHNVIPNSKASYRALPTLSTFTDALNSACLGSFWIQDDANLVYNFSGDADALYQLTSGTTWTDVTGPSGPYAASNWEFLKFGERVIAFAKEADPQYYDLGAVPGFADLPGTPPRAQRAAVVRDFVVLGDTALNGGGDDDTVGPNFIQWSGFNNSELWTPSLATQSDYQRIPGRGGRVQRIVPGEYGLIFQEHSIFKMTYVGPPTIFRLDEVEKRRGTPAGNSVAWAGRFAFFYGWDGFYVTDGGLSKNISSDRVSRWFKRNSDITALSSMRAAVDRQNRLVMWAFRSSASLAFNDKLIIYNWVSDRWSEGDLTTQVIEEYVSPGYTLDELDAVLPGGIDADSILIDSDEFAGGALSIAAFNSSNILGVFSGAAGSGYIDTREIEGGDNDRIFIDSIRPLISTDDPNTTLTAQVGTRNTQVENVSFATAKGVNGINGEINVRSNSRYARIRLNITGECEHAQGVKLSVKNRKGRR